MNYEKHFVSDVGVISADLDDRLAARRRRRILIALGAGVLLILVVGLWMGLRHSAAPDAAAGPQHQIPTVSVLDVRPESVATDVSGTGAIAARRDMPVSVVGEGGEVKAVLVEPGDWVKAGQPLATIERSVQTQQTASLAAQVAVARADAKLAESNLTRARALVPNGFISKADLDSREATRDSAVARVKVAIAQFEQSRASMARLDVRAPAEGLVLTRTVEPGQVVSGGSGTLFRIAKGGEMEMKLAVNEADLPGITAGARAEVTPVGTRVPVVGQVWQVSPVVDPQTRQGMARILLHYDRALRPGAFAHARVTTGRLGGVLLPESAVLSDEKGNYVFIVGRGDKVVRRAVETGPVTDAGIAVLKGLNGGEAVVSTAGGFLSPGDTIRPLRRAAPRG